jgi:hypothetical protein
MSNDDLFIRLMLLALVVCAAITTWKYVKTTQSVQYITIPIVPLPSQQEFKPMARITGFAPQG